jgi:hypothetical protein
MSAEICLSMAGAKQLETLGSSWFRPGPYVQQWCARTLYCLHRGARRGVATSEAGEEAWPPSPRGLIEVSANIVGRWRVCERLLSVVPCLPPRLRGCPSFYRPRRGQLICMPHYFYTCCYMANSVVELMAVLANLGLVVASWRVLCPNRSDFEGRGVVVDRSGSERARGGR